jgi:hypothetical protein
MSRVNHLLDHRALLIQRPGIPARIRHPMLVVVGEKEEVLPAGLHAEPVFGPLAEDGDLSALFAFHLLIDVYDILSTIQRVPGLGYLARRHHSADDHHLGVLDLLRDRQRVRANREGCCGKKNASDCCGDSLQWARFPRGVVAFPL